MEGGVVGPDTLLSSSRPELRHIWTLAFWRPIPNLFDLQDRITRQESPTPGLDE